MQSYNRLFMGQHPCGAVFFLHFVHSTTESLTIPTTDTQFSTRYCIKCKEGNKRKAQNEIYNAKCRRKTLCAEN